MSEYNLFELLDKYTDKDFFGEICETEYLSILKNIVHISKPDYVVVIDPRNNNKILFSKNYNLDFGTHKNESIIDIVNATDIYQLPKILEVDKRCMDFMDQYPKLSKLAVFQLRFTVSLRKNNPRTFQRNISFIRRKHKDSTHVLMVVSIFDVTKLQGLYNEARIDIRCTDTNCKEFEMHEIVHKFVNESNNYLSSKPSLTKRELEILKFISNGLTSSEISKKLFISKTTVNTHRQNLIKKFGVKNTASLVKIL